MAFCVKCNTPLADNVQFCPSCGQAQPGATPSPAPGGTQTGGMEPHIAAALSYIAIVAIVFLLVDPFRNDRFVRFHSFQSLFFAGVWFALTIVLSVIPILGWILLIPLMPLALGVWVFCIYKAFNKEWFKLPMLGDWAMQQVEPKT